MNSIESNPVPRPQPPSAPASLQPPIPQPPWLSVGPRRARPLPVGPGGGWPWALRPQRGPQGGELAPGPSRPPPWGRQSAAASFHPAHPGQNPHSSGCTVQQLFLPRGASLLTWMV